ncbi:alpha/beta fold hydrolase [Staphylococcus saccharolyticus]|uniref:Lysophospholipase-like protein n=1 Tax=Staphylococcus saccharolyticus TaxID=33028 RepID=A0A380H3W1_9STAP|nr:alpha/beta hydrolase [Staphylococcus saccharolyticus]MBL7565001.1 alpha/beta hydrolase [Staphylococcus saccharolyticus]MBL7571962.1 alpha/beta hydrolase [Staphylococcus saccharolyticus]QQB98443.1 alpha/beta hydrolase [Staphylococcus saccharolyticus]QRJ67341.1 alpha/beta hydrolase [Staphylococcus saccharolyticus]RTX97792.1 alpha/beta hydrolase [Staphylococcus saccharolyticus]
MWKWETESDAKGVVVIAHNILEHTGRYAYVITMLRRNGYHVIMGDLPGQGQTSRAKKGQIDDFNTYHEHLLEWIKIANEYKIPTFVFGVGLGGLIILNLLEKVDLPVEGMILISPMLELRKTGKGRKNKIISNIGKVSKDTRFKVGITSQDLTRNEEIIEEIDNDGVMLKKVTYRWYNLINEKMKETMDHIKDIKSLPTMIMYGTKDKILETTAICEFKDKFKSNELYFKAWDGLYHEIQNEPERDQVMRYVLTFLNNSVNTMGFVVKEEEVEDI